MSLEVIENLRRAVIEYDAEAAVSWAERAVAEKVEPAQALGALTEAIRQVGDRFGKGELWLPDLVGAADAMQAAMPFIEAELRRTGAKRESLGTVVVGTVFGDIHSIGKAMVCTLLTAGGFEVHDLGVNIKAEEFIEAIDEYKADVLAMSALLTMTAAEQRKVIDTLKERGIREKVKVMVGGGAITADFAESIGADGYDPTAPGAVGLAKRLLGK
ncbi:MAG: cobalamin-dependent protein [Dehalococcoidia bacterium]|nr:cobalamin-dependent protein [Dehalococcoidia bacterium]